MKYTQKPAEKPGAMLLEELKEQENIMKVKIQQRSVYHKFTEVEIEVPNDVQEDELMDWINNNEQLWADQMDEKNTFSKIEYGNGVDDYDGMNESDADSEWRFQCPNGYGGHL